jgi:hypothetical protein
MTKFSKIAVAALAIFTTGVPASAASLASGQVEQYRRVLDNIMAADTPADIPDPIDAEPKQPKEPKEPKEPKAPSCKDLFD